MTHYFTVVAALSLTDETANRIYNKLLGQMKPAHTQYKLAEGGPWTLEDAVLGRLDANYIA